MLEVYYLFTLQPQASMHPTVMRNNLRLSSGKLFYSVVDMRLDNGRGGIVSGKKNVLLDSMLSEGMIAVPGDQCSDIWLVVHEVDKPVFKAFHITEDGIQTTPVLSQAGTQLNQIGAYFVGGMAISPNRKWIAVTSGFYERTGTYIYPVTAPAITGTLLCRFDAKTGMVSEGLLIDESSSYGICFSPDSRKLFVSIHHKEGPYEPPKLEQYDISFYPSLPAIKSSKKEIAILVNVTQLKLYKGKVYGVANIADNNQQAGYLFEIQKPDLHGDACMFVDSSIALSFSTSGILGLPQEVVFPLGKHTSIHHPDTLLCTYGSSEGLLLAARDSFETYRWNNGTLGREITVYESGMYSVESRSGCWLHKDTFYVKVVDIPLDLGEDTVLCNAASFRLETKVEEAVYHWQDESTNPFFIVKESGDYHVKVSREGCSATDSIRVDMVKLKVNMVEDTVLCIGDEVNFIFKVNAPDGASFQWSTGATTNQIAISDTGHYWVKAAYPPCNLYKEVFISKEMCFCNTFIPNAFSPNGDGVNDIFTPVIEQDCPVSGYHFSVYNRFGQRVFYTNEPKKGWNGYFRNQPANLGVYFYELLFYAGTREKKVYRKGDVSLIR